MTTEIIKAVEDINRDFQEFQKANKQALEQMATKGYIDPLLEDVRGKLNEAISVAEDAKLAAEKAEAMAKARHVVEEVKGGMKPESLKKHNALMKYIKSGEQSLSADEMSDLTVHTKAMGSFEGPDGGYAVMPEFDKAIIQIIRETSPIRPYAEVITTGSDRVEEPYEGDDFTSGWVGEETSRDTETDTGKLNMIGWDVHEQYAMPAVTQKLLDDAYFDVEGYITNKLANLFARTENTSFVSGDGIKKPRGFLTYASGTGFNQIQQVASGTSAVVTYNGIIDLVFSLKDGYLPGSIFMMKRSTVKEIRKMVDGEGRGIWVPGFGGTPSTLMEFPVVRADDMPAVGASALSIAFGNFREAYRIVDRIGTRILRDPYTKKGYIRVYTTKRVGGAVKNFEALKLQVLST
jgi:HK97 family phage major capsid protein